MSAVAELPDIDLIPAAFRRQRALLKTLRKAGVAIVAVLVASAAAAAALRQATSASRAEVARLSTVAAAAEQQRAAIASLMQRKAAIEERLAGLAALRRPVAVDELMATVARAVPSRRMWFDSWRFAAQETGGAVPGAPEAANEGPALRSPPNLEMTIAGRALDHSAVSEFATALLGHPSMREVNVPRVQRDYDNAGVRFDLVVTVAVPETSK